MSNPNPVPNSTWIHGLSATRTDVLLVPGIDAERNHRANNRVRQQRSASHLSELQANSTDEAIRATAANMLAPFLHSKLTATPAPRFIETELTLPPLDSLENAVQSIALIEAAVAENRLDVQSAQDLIGMINAYIAGKNIMEIAELQERLTNIETSIANNPQAQLPHVTGGLPVMPGCENVILPNINGVPASLPSPAPSPGLGEPSQTIDHEPSTNPTHPVSLSIGRCNHQPICRPRAGLGRLP